MPTLRNWTRATLCLLAGGAVLVARAEAIRTFMRYPTLYGNTIVFVAHDNLWSVARTGGVAARLTADGGRDLMPRFSPDGRWIAFTGEYQGNRDVYVIPATGGPAKRLTFTSDVVDEAPLRWGPNNMVVTWTPDSSNIVFLSRREAWNTWFGRLFTVPLDGGLPQALPLDRGGFMSYAPDGKRIAYTRIFRDFRTWKRYDGGLNQDIDIYDFQTRQLKHVTDWSGTETAPMWFGNTIYFLSDHAADRRRNIWAYALESGEFRQITHFTDYDIDFPSLGAQPQGQAGQGQTGIVFQQGGSLHVLDLPSEQLHDLDVSVPDDGTRTAARWVDARTSIRDQDTAQHTDFDLAPNGGRAVFSARGDLFTLPAEHGNTRNLTETSNAYEDHPSWSPDGKTIAYTTDITGEQQLAVRPAEGGPEKVLTHFDRGYFYGPRWSPNGAYLAFSDHEHRLWFVPAAGGEPVEVARDQYVEIHDYAWSPDSRWLAYSITRPNQQSGIWLFSLETRKATLVSDSTANDYQPAFEPSGKYLLFISTRHENPTFSRSEFNIATLKMTGIYIATLKRGTPSPFAPQSDEGIAGHDKQAHGDRHGDEQSAGNDSSQDAGKDGGASEDKSHPAKGVAKQPKPLEIDLDGLMARSVPLPITPAEISAFDV